MADYQLPDSAKHWMQSMEKKMDEQRANLRGRDPVRVAHNSGAQWKKDDQGNEMLSLNFIRQPLIVQIPGYTINDTDGNQVSTMTQGLVTSYLETANGAQRGHKWIAFRELPDGMFYHQAFDGYTGAVLARIFGDDLKAFQRGAKIVGGDPLSGFGDAAYQFHVLPNLWMAAVYWLGDEEDGFPPQAKLLFDRAADQYLITDGLAIIGSHLVRQIIKAADKQ